ncbi:hypothetical protein GCM10009670_28360 [Citricoccus alkalitolerans]
MSGWVRISFSTLLPRLPYPTMAARILRGELDMGGSPFLFRWVQVCRYAVLLIEGVESSVLSRSARE